MPGRWFPPTVSEEEIQRAENKKLNELSERAVGRINAVLEAGYEADVFSISFDPVIRKSTMVAFVTELLEAVATMAAADTYDFSYILYGDYPILVTLGNIEKIATIPATKTPTILVQMRQKKASTAGQ
jgi:hypothetical protein